MQSEKHTEGQPCLKTLLAAELFSKLTEEEREFIISLIKFLSLHEQ